MNFAPYQDQSPEIERALSPPPRNRASIDSSRARSPPSRPANHVRRISEVQQQQQQQQQLPHPSAFASAEPSSRPSISHEERGQHLEAFDTSLPIRLDYEAMLAYILLPPAGGVLLLLLEHKSDYVRFHAWQSSMLFATLFILHLLIAWSAVLSWMLFAIDLVLIGFLSMRAYRDVDTLEHYEVPFFGRLADSFVDDE